MQPLATDLNITVDISCDRDDPDCVAEVVNGYEGNGNILICWEHHALTDIVVSVTSAFVEVHLQQLPNS